MYTTLHIELCRGLIWSLTLSRAQWHQGRQHSHVVLICWGNPTRECYADHGGLVLCIDLFVPRQINDGKRGLRIESKQDAVFDCRWSQITALLFQCDFEFFFRSVTFPVAKARQQDRSQRNLAKPRTSFCRIIGRIFPNPCLTDSDRLPACLTHEGFPQICSATALFKASNFVLLKVTKDVKAENVVLHGERAVLIDFGIVPSLQFLDPVSLNCSNCLLPCRSRISMISLCFPRPVELMMKWEWKNELDHRAMLHQRSSHTDPTTKRLPSSISVCIFAFAIMIYSQISGSWGRNMEE